jgi:uncharacterized membrane protein
MTKKNIRKRAAQIKKIRKERKKSLSSRVFGKLKAYFFTGILVTAPVTITFYMAYKLILYIDRSINGLIPPRFRLAEFFPCEIPGIGVIVLVLGLVLIGMFTTGYLGRFFVRLGEKIVSKMPFISSVYSLLKQVFETFFSDQKQSFNQAVLLQYPREGIWTIGFVSAVTSGETAKHMQQKMLNIFVPTTPNPTSGFLIFVPETDVIKLKMSVEDALKFVISCGIVTPEDARKLQKK